MYQSAVVRRRIGIKYPKCLISTARFGVILFVLLVATSAKIGLADGHRSATEGPAINLTAYAETLSLIPSLHTPPDTTVTDPVAPELSSPDTPPTRFHFTYEQQRQAHRSLRRRAEATEVLDLGGLVVDETITPQGRTFFGAFFDVWQSPAVGGFYTVRVHEEPSPGRGTLVQVFVNDDITFRARLQPQSPFAELALQAARRTYGYVQSGQGILRIR